MNWETARLNSLCTVFADGDWIESKDQSESGIRLIQTGNVGIGDFKDREAKARYISEQTFKRLRCTEIVEGDCLISRLPDPVGRSCILPDTGERMITAVDCTIVRFDQKRILPAFFNFYSQSDDYLRAIDRETSGTTRKRISRSKLGEAPVPVPPLPEQQRIVGILDETFAGIATAKANAEKNLRNARELFESSANNEVVPKATWQLLTAEQVSTHIVDCPHSTPKWSESGVVCLRTTNFHVDALQLDSVRHVSDQTYRERIARLEPCEGDVLYSREGGILGIACLFPEGLKACLGQRMMQFRLNNSIVLPEYFTAVLNSAAILQRVRKLTGGAAAPHLNIRDIRQFPIPLPPLSDQKKIVERLSVYGIESRRLESLYQQKLAVLDVLKKSLLHQAFTGQLAGGLRAVLESVGA